MTIPASDNTRFYKKTLNKILLVLFSFLFSLSCFLVNVEKTGFILVLILSVAFAVPVYCICVIAITIIEQAMSRNEEAALKPRRLSKWKTIGFLTAGLVIAYFISFLVYYPGCCSADTLDTLKMVLNLDFYSAHFRYYTLNNHHPYLYTLFISAVIHVGEFLGAPLYQSVSAAALIQMVLFAFCAGYSVYITLKLWRSKTVGILAYLFFLLNPLLGKLSVTLWKDIPFTALTLLFLSINAELLLEENVSLTFGRLFILLLLSLLVSLSRHGGILIPGILMLLDIIFIKSLRKTASFCLVSLAVCYAAISGPLYKSLGVSPSHFVEAVAVPLQQLSRVAAYDGVLNDEEYLFLNQLLPFDKYKEKYNPAYVNPVKFDDHFSNEFLEEHKKEFFETWLSVGKKNQEHYLYAWIEETKGFWNIATDTTTYTVPPGFKVGDMVENPAEDLNPFISVEASDLIINDFILFTRPFTNCAALGWIVFFLLTASIVLRNKKAVLSVPLVALWFLYVLNTPTNQQFRYILPLYVSLPLLLSSTVSRLLLKNS